MSEEFVAGNPVRAKSFEFALESVRLCRVLRDRKEQVLAAQFLRAGTSIGANVEEALAGQSKRDFVAKMAIASKEAREAHYWLRLIKESGVAGITADSQLAKADELIRLLTAIVKTAQQKLSRERSIRHSKLNIQN